MLLLWWICLGWECCHCWPTKKMHSYYINATFFWCQRLILFSLLATFPLVFLLTGLVFTLTLHQQIRVNTVFGTLSLCMCVCSLNHVFDHSRVSICRCTPPPPSEPHANCLSRVVSTRQYFFTPAQTYQASDVSCRSRHLIEQKYTQFCWHNVKLDYFVFDSYML